jgi:hypothetical protein
VKSQPIAGEGRCLFSFNRARRLACDVIGHAIDPAHLIRNPRRNTIEKAHIKGLNIRRHAIHACHGTQSAGLVVAAAIAHHAHRAYGQQHGKGLRLNTTPPAAAKDLLDRICPPESRQTIAGDGRPLGFVVAAPVEMTPEEWSRTYGPGG